MQALDLQASGQQLRGIIEHACIYTPTCTTSRKKIESNVFLYGTTES